MKGGKEFDNRDVVPYNPYLARRFEAHINVEVVTSLKSVKYLFKYTFKGHDRAALELHDGNEVAAHVDARYVGPAEACWRLFGFPLQGMSHHVERLAVHLPQMQAVLFAEGAERQAAAAASTQQTTLTAWFELNAATPAYRDVLYTEIPTRCVWHKQSRKWGPRKQQAAKILGRMHGAHPAEGERYFLYLLLLHVPGAQSFEDLLRVPHRHDPAASFREAAVLRGLLHDDAEYAAALEEAEKTHMPKQFRIFFAHLLMACDIQDATALWLRFRDSFAEDFALASCDRRFDAALAHIQDVLSSFSKKTSDFGLPLPVAFSLEAFHNRDLRAELSRDADLEGQVATEMRSKMYPLQAQAFDLIAAAIDAGEGGVFFVDGPGGSGKSYLFEALIHHTRGRHLVALACAWSGLAATLLPGGRTVSSLFGLPVPLLEEGVAQYQVKPRSTKGKLLQAAAALFWDEASMTPRIAVENANDCL